MPEPKRSIWSPPSRGSAGINVIRASETCRGWNGIHYKLGHVGQERRLDEALDERRHHPAGRRGVCAHPRRLRGDALHPPGPRPPRVRRRACKKVVENEAGDFIYIEPGVPHEVFNLSDTEPVVAVVARSDADEWENIIPYDRNSG